MNYPFIKQHTRDTSTGVLINVRVQPRSSRQGPLEILDNQIKWGVSSGPVDGAANKELCEHVAKLLKVSKAAVEIVSGGKSRNKVLFIRGVTETSVTKRLL